MQWVQLSGFIRLNRIKQSKSSVNRLRKCLGNRFENSPFNKKSGLRAGNLEIVAYGEAECPDVTVA